MKKVILIAFTAAAVTLGASTYAASDTAGSPGPIRSRLRVLFSGIGQELREFRQQAPLSDQQRSQVKDILKSHKSEIAAQFQKGKEAHRNMKDAVEQSGPDSALTLKAADSVGDAARTRALLVGKIASEIAQILTPEQRKLAGEARTRIESTVDGRFPGLSE